MWPIPKKTKLVEVFIRCFGQRRERDGYYHEKPRWRKARVVFVGSIGNSCGVGVELVRTPLYKQRGVVLFVDRSCIRTVRG